MGDRLTAVEVDGQRFLQHVDAADVTRTPAPASASQPEHECVHLLPPWDEFLLGYKDRSAMLTRGEEDRVAPGGNGLFRATVVADGLVVGTWSRRRTSSREVVRVVPFGSFTTARWQAVERAGAAYGRFLERDVDVGPDS